MENDDDLWTDPIGPSPDSPSPPPLPDSPPPPRPPEPEGDPPPSPESYSTPVSLLDWATGKLLCLRTALFVLLGTFGFLQEETLDRFKELEKSAGAQALSDSWIDSLWPSKGSSTASGPNVASTSPASSSVEESSTAVDQNVPSASKKSFWVGESSMDFGSNDASISQASSLTGESSIAFDPNVPSTSKKSFWVGESSIAFDPNVPSTSKKSFWVGESAIAFDPNVPSTSKKSFWMGESAIAFDPNVPSTSKKSFWTGESSMDFGSNVASTSPTSSWMGETSMDFDLNVPSSPSGMGESSFGFDPNVAATSQASSWIGESSMDFDPNLPSISQASSRKRKYPTPKPSSDDDDDDAIHIGHEFASRGDPLFKGIEDFCAKYLRHNEVCKEMKDALFDVETIFVIKRNRRVRKNSVMLNVGKFMALKGGVKELRNLAEKIVRHQKVLCNKLNYIMRRKARLDQLFREGHNLSSMARKDNAISYSMYWIYKNLVIVDKIMERKRILHVMFEAVLKKVQDDLSSF